jgi:hypothetical protein
MAEPKFYALEELPVEQSGPRKPLFGDDDTLLKAGLALVALMTVWRFYIGLISHVIWEESHFVVSGEYFDFGYPDIPAGFPWLAKIITAIFGWQVWPLRIVALAIATAIPFAVYFLAKPLTTRRNAIWAAIISLLLPPSALNGTIFYPEGALQLLLVLMLGCLVRAFDEDATTETSLYTRHKWWIWAGVCAGLGQLVHFRFLIPGLAVVAYMSLDKRGRTFWTQPGPYITAALAVVGLVPALIYNATHDWPAIQFHVVNRPRFDPDIGRIISFLMTQFGITTPLFFIALVAAGKVSLFRDRGTPGTMLGYQTAIIFVFYVFQTLVNKKVMPHWPFMAYLPLLPYVPGVLIAFADAAASNGNRMIRAGLIATGPLLALAIGVVASIYQWQYRHSAEIPYTERQHNILKNENWSLLEPDLAAATARAKARFGPDVAIATSGHISAVHLEFPADGKKDRRVYTLGDPYDVVARFVVARHDWKLDLASLQRDRAGKGVVIAMNEPDYLLHVQEDIDVYRRLCATFEDIEPFKQSALPPGRTLISFYTARVRTQPLAQAPQGPCPLIPSLYIASPGRARFIKTGDDRNHYGMAADPAGLTKVEIVLDGKTVIPVRYGLNTKESPTPDVLNYDPNWPNLQFDYKFPQGTLVPGEHVISIRATRSDGSMVNGPPRTIYVIEKK